MRDSENAVPAAVGWIGRGEAFADAEAFVVGSQGVVEGEIGRCRG
jgi:hypothetical protein